MPHHARLADFLLSDRISGTGLGCPRANHRAVLGGRSTGAVGLFRTSLLCRCDVRPFPPKRKSHLLNREHLSLRHNLKPLRVPLFIFQETSLSSSSSCRVVFSVCELVPQYANLFFSIPILPCDKAASKVRPHAPHEISNIVVASRAIALLCCHQPGCRPLPTAFFLGSFPFRRRANACTGRVRLQHT